MVVYEKIFIFAPKFNNYSYNNMDKINITQDFLFKFWQEHNLTVTMLANKMGVSEGIVRGSFRHTLNRHGKPLQFSKANIEKLNAALQQIANELRDCVITFGGDKTYTNMRKITYDPGVLPAIHRLDEYFNITGLAERVMGWNKNKRNTVLSVKSSPVYGNITQEDVNRINMELLSIAGVLSSYKVVEEDK